MARSGCLIIDDVQASLSGMTELGREVATTSAETIRAAVLDFAVRRNWAVVRHGAYVEWATEAIERSVHMWLVLDPLFPVAELGDRCRRVRLTRRFDNNESIVVRPHAPSEGAAPIDLSNMSGEVGLVDDTAASGSTLRHIARLVTHSRGSVAQVLLCSSSRSARDGFRATVRSARWAEFVQGDWQTIHLRDGCPYLPYSGRPTDQQPILGVDGTFVEVRVPSSAVLGNNWQVLCMDPAVCHAIAAARSEVARRLSATLGRAACIRDLCLLGRFVPALAKQGEMVTGDAKLESLLSSAPPR